MPGRKAFGASTARRPTNTRSTRRSGTATPSWGYCRESISDTTEYGLDEWNVGQFAAALGKKDDAAKYLALAQSYKHIFDPDQAWTYDAAGTDAKPEWKGSFRVKDGNGNFEPWFGLTSPKGARESTVETGRIRCVL